MPAAAVKHRCSLVPRAARLMTSLEERRRRAHYRAAHRGTREMDWLLGRYAQMAVPAMSHGDLVHFERLLAVPDPALHDWIVLGDAMQESELEPLVLAIRKFHGLGSSQ